MNFQNSLHQELAVTKRELRYAWKLVARVFEFWTVAERHLLLSGGRVVSLRLSLALVGMPQK